MHEEDFSYLDGDNSKYLIGAVGNAKYVDVRDELAQIKKKCDSINIKIFDHSMDAINYLKNDK